MDKIRKKKFWNNQRLAVFGGSGILIAFVLYTFVFADGRSKLNVQTDRLTISTVKQGKFDEYIILQGVVQPLKTVRVDAIVGGHVVQKLAEGGSMVKEGDVLLMLENQSLQLSFLQSETEANRLVNDLQNTRQRLKVDKFTLQKNLATLDYQIAQAHEEFKRNEQLWNGKAISEAEYNKAKREYERLARQREIEMQSQNYQEENSHIQINQLEGTLNRTERNVGLWRKNLDNLSIKAPIAGLLSSIDVEIGSNIAQGQNIAQIDDLSGFKVRAEIDEHYISRVFVGLKATCEFSDQKIPIVISKVYPEVRNGRFKADFVFEKSSPADLRRGLTLPTYLELGKSAQSLLLPVGAFFSDSGGSWVYVLDSSGNRATKRAITLGRKNPDYYEVLSGLSVGEQVITSSYSGFGNKEVLMLNK
ncbi:MAG: HlyD family efflux transporter periplasmic adaptor subunit [Bacteroidetes bacterium]|nr:MAG: HlyD family efflux transporter periplasmic adaptor subunit [Bacteroidota bacterium]